MTDMMNVVATQEVIQALEFELTERTGTIDGQCHCCGGTSMTGRLNWSADCCADTRDVLKRLKKQVAAEQQLDKHHGEGCRIFRAVVLAMQEHGIEHVDTKAKFELCDITGLAPSQVQWALDHDAWAVAFAPVDVRENFCRGF